MIIQNCSTEYNGAFLFSSNPHLGQNKMKSSWITNTPESTDFLYLWTALLNLKENKNKNSKAIHWGAFGFLKLLIITQRNKNDLLTHFDATFLTFVKTKHYNTGA